jgi:tRNA A37 threonylcarbamoyltransferase TsaD
MHAHILAHFIDEDGFDKPTFPFLALTISGGHTQIVKVNDFFNMEIIVETTDDAVGEAFDKTVDSLKSKNLGVEASKVGPETTSKVKEIETILNEWERNIESLYSKAEQKIEKEKKQNANLMNSQMQKEEDKEIERIREKWGIL